MKLKHYKELYSHDMALTFKDESEWTRENLIEEIIERMTIAEWKILEKKLEAKEKAK